MSVADVLSRCAIATLLLALTLGLTMACDSTVPGWERFGDDQGSDTPFPDAGTPSSSPPIESPDAQPAFVPLTISGISVANGKTYPLIAEGVTTGSLRYIDRDYTITELPPSLAGMAFLKTSNSDANTTSLSHIRFEINKPAIVYIAHDDRKSTKPTWLAAFTDTGTDLKDSDGSSGKFSIFAAEMPAGTVTLGGNIAGGNEESMYSVFIADAEL